MLRSGKPMEGLDDWAVRGTWSIAVRLTDISRLATGFRARGLHPLIPIRAGWPSGSSSFWPRLPAPHRPLRPELAALVG